MSSSWCESFTYIQSLFKLRVDFSKKTPILLLIQLKKTWLILILKAWKTDTTHNIYLDLGDSDFPSDHIRNKLLPTTVCIRQRFVSSIGNIEKALWIFNCLGRSGWFLAVRNDSWQPFFHIRPTTFLKFILKKKYPNQKKLGSLVFKPEKERWF